MLSMQEMSDRFEIQDLLIRYSHCVDTRDWDAYERIFTPDALIDYSEMGGSAGTVKETRQFLEMAMPNFSSFQHMVSNISIALDGDTARVRSVLHNPMVIDRGDGKTDVFFCGLWYNDVVVRTSDGWRFKERVEEKSYFFNVPDDFAVPSESVS